MILPAPLSWSCYAASRCTAWPRPLAARMASGKAKRRPRTVPATAIWNVTSKDQRFCGRRLKTGGNILPSIFPKAGMPRDRRSSEIPVVVNDHTTKAREQVQITKENAPDVSKRGTTLLFERLWRRESFEVPARQPKKAQLWLADGCCFLLRAEYPNHVWSYDSNLNPGFKSEKN